MLVTSSFGSDCLRKRQRERRYVNQGLSAHFRASPPLGPLAPGRCRWIRVGGDNCDASHQFSGFSLVAQCLTRFVSECEMRHGSRRLVKCAPASPSHPVADGLGLAAAAIVRPGPATPASGTRAGRPRPWGDLARALNAAPQQVRLSP